MGLAFDILLTLLIELPIFILFYKKRKRPMALMYGALVNLISWPLMHILKSSTEINVYVIDIAVVVGEGIGLWLLTECGWKKAFIMSAIANTLSFIITNLINYDLLFNKDMENIITP